jgi:hypothetical protein
MNLSARPQSGSPLPGQRTRSVLLVCGIAASLLYVAADIVAALRIPSYRYADQAVSELMAIAAPTRPFLLVCFSVYNVLAIAFGIGVWIAAGQNRALRIAGMLQAVCAVAGFAGLWFAPMHQRGEVFSATDAMHIVITVVIVLSTLLSIAFGAAALGKAFRRYSIATIATLVIFSALTGLQGGKIAAGFPTPWVGVTERIAIYSTMLWALVLAAVLLRAERRSGGE